MCGSRLFHPNGRRILIQQAKQVQWQISVGVESKWQKDMIQQAKQGTLISGVVEFVVQLVV